MNDDEKTTETEQPISLKRAMPVVRVVKLLDFIANDLFVLPVCLLTLGSGLKMTIPIVIAIIVVALIVQLIRYKKSPDGKETRLADVFLGLSWIIMAALPVLYLFDTLMEVGFSGLAYIMYPFLKFCASAPFIGFELGILFRRVFKPGNGDANPSQEV